MGKYSSSSDSSDYKSRARRKKRSSNSSSPVRHRSSSHRSNHSSSRHRDRGRESNLSSKSSSSRYKSHRRSRSHSSRRSNSRERSKRRSRSHDRHRSSRKSRKYKRRSRSSSSSTSRSPSTSSKSSKPSKPDKDSDALREKLLLAIKAAESADLQLKQQGALPKNVRSRNDITSLAQPPPDIDAVNEIEAEGFVPKTFTSSKGKASTVKVEIKEEPIEAVAGETSRSVYNSSLFDDSQAKLDRWVKKLFQIRQRALNGDSPK